jgi:hypothetical protein
MKGSYQKRKYYKAQISSIGGAVMVAAKPEVLSVLSEPKAIAFSTNIKQDDYSAKQ